MKPSGAARRRYRVRVLPALAEKAAGYETVEIDVDLAYLAWVMRRRQLYGETVPGRIEAWLGGLAARPAVAAGFELVRALA
jgi:hypothetical protein